jgi:transposase-like protein
LLWWFAWGFSANKTAKEVTLPQQRTHTCFSTIRKGIYDYEQFEMKHLLGQAKKVAISGDFSNKSTEGESEKYYAKAIAVKLYNGARIKKTSIFTLYELDSRVYVVPLTEITKNTLRDILKGRIILESNMNEYFERRHKMLPGEHGSEEFWGYLKERLVNHRGISKKNLIYYIKENEFRFNQRHLRKKRFVERLISILLTPPP